MDEEKRMIDDLHKEGSNYLREYAYVRGDNISKFIYIWVKIFPLKLFSATG
jgi:hypothetical protein